MNHDAIVQKCTSFYLESPDFNGYPVSRLTREFGLDDARAKAVLADLLESKQITIEFGVYHPNPHIKSFKALEPAKQLELLQSLPFSSHFCLYPSTTELVRRVEPEKFTEAPFSREMALGAGQLEFRAFDLSVLEYYRNDPRYYYHSNSIHGNICVHDDFFESAEMPEKDQVLLQTFGFAYDDQMNRAVAVFLRYLGGLSPEHQRIWAAHKLADGFELHPDYYRTSIIGEWAERLSIFDAFIEELRIINSMCSLMSRPGLFRDTFKVKPKGFDFLLRPTSKEFQDFCLLLDKMMSDNINKAFFGNDVATETEAERPDGKVVVTAIGTIGILESWLRKYFRPVDLTDLDRLFATFRKVRKLRQKPAHALDDNRFDQANFKMQRELAIEAYSAVRTIRLILANHPAVRLNPPKIVPELYEGKIWSF